MCVYDEIDDWVKIYIRTCIENKTPRDNIIKIYDGMYWIMIHKGKKEQKNYKKKCVKQSPQQFIADTLIIIQVIRWCNDINGVIKWLKIFSFLMNIQSGKLRAHPLCFRFEKKKKCLSGFCLIFVICWCCCYVIWCNLIVVKVFIVEYMLNRGIYSFDCHSFIY